MSKRRKVRVTCQQGNALLMSAASFTLPEKLGETQYSVADRGLAEQDVGMLYRELKSHSPMLIKEKRYCFGPIGNWKLAKKDDGVRDGTMEMIDIGLEVELSFSDDALSGAFWCLVSMLHPGSNLRLAASSQMEIAWPLAELLRLKKMVRKEIGLETAGPRRLDLDEEEAEEIAGEDVAEDVEKREGAETKEN